ncbi:MAG TPA: hypothetical protein VJA18_06520 [Candidatus Nanoarchaeia archaeon]|nr:hypothetical protein [Candidatus Nanoarchaeia archaeon]
MKSTPLQLQEILKLLSQYSSTLPEGAKDRIVIDEKGGLAYPLFGSYFSDGLPLVVDDIRKKSNLIRMFLDSRNDYVDEAEQHAWDCGFALVYIVRGTPETGRWISSDFDPNNNPMYNQGVGKIPITSARSVQKFCEMVKSGHDNFEGRYNKIRELAERLR